MAVKKTQLRFVGKKQYRIFLNGERLKLSPGDIFFAPSVEVIPEKARSLFEVLEEKPRRTRSRKANEPKTEMAKGLKAVETEEGWTVVNEKGKSVVDAILSKEAAEDMVSKGN